jgi:O-antigen/teichoic acid export membrane protein
VIVGIVGSYKLHSYRPKFSLKKKFEQWSFTKWMFARGILGFLRAQLDNLMVSKLFTIGELGVYNVIRGISVLPATDIIVPSVEPLLASFSRNKYDTATLDHQLRTSLLMVLLLIMPVCTILAFYSDAIVFVLLGDKWKDQGPLLANLTILLMSFSLGSILGNFYIAMGKVRLLFFYNLLSLTFIFSLLLILTGDNLVEFALLRGILGLISTSLWLMLALHFTSSHKLSFLLLLSTPVLLSYLALLLTDSFSLQIDSIYFSLAWDVATFGIFYLVLTMLFYVTLFNKMKEWHHLKTLLINTLLTRIRK